MSQNLIDLLLLRYLQISHVVVLFHLPHDFPDHIAAINVLTVLHVYLSTLLDLLNEHISGPLQTKPQSEIHIKVFLFESCFHKFRLTCQQKQWLLGQLLLGMDLDQVHLTGLKLSVVLFRKQIIVIHNASECLLDSFTCSLDLPPESTVFNSHLQKLQQYGILFGNAEYFPVLDIHECLLVKHMRILPLPNFPLLYIHDLSNMEYVFYSRLHIPHQILITLNLVVLLSVCWIPVICVDYTWNLHLQFGHLVQINSECAVAITKYMGGSIKLLLHLVHLIKCGIAHFLLRWQSMGICLKDFLREYRLQLVLVFVLTILLHNMILNRGYVSGFHLDVHWHNLLAQSCGFS